MEIPHQPHFMEIQKFFFGYLKPPFQEKKSVCICLWKGYDEVKV